MTHSRLCLPGPAGGERQRAVSWPLPGLCARASEEARSLTPIAGLSLVSHRLSLQRPSPSLVPEDPRGRGRCPQRGRCHQGGALEWKPERHPQCPVSSAACPAPPPRPRTCTLAKRVLRTVGSERHRAPLAPGSIAAIRLVLACSLSLSPSLCSRVWPYTSPGNRDAGSGFKTVVLGSWTRDLQ